MKKRRFIFITLLMIVFIDFFLSDNAYAYLDPGTGSYIFQLLAAAIIGSLFAIKIFWRRIISFIKNLFDKRRKR